VRAGGSGLRANKLRRDLPYLGENGVAAQLWEIRLDGWNKIATDGRKLPPARGSLMIWGRQLDGTGHVAFVLGTVNSRMPTVRVVDSNWGWTSAARFMTCGSTPECSAGSCRRNCVMVGGWTKQVTGSEASGV
jgi:hypothetical protein